MKLSKAVIKKYGISKKAWAVQRGMSGSKKVYKRKSSSQVKYKKRGRSMAKKKTHRKSKSMFGALQNPILGSVGVVAYESLISPMIPLQGVAKDMLELVGGLYLSKKRGILGATGKSLVTINAYQLTSSIVGNKLQGLIGNSTPSANYNYGGY